MDSPAQAVRLIGTALDELERTDRRYGVITICAAGVWSRQQSPNGCDPGRYGRDYHDAECRVRLHSRPERARTKGTAIADDDCQLKHEIAIRISVLARLLHSDFNRGLSDVNITRSQWGLIAVVAGRPGSTQRSIAEILEMSEASAGRLIDRLCADGLLERRERHDDRRARAVYLTPAAEPLLSRATEVSRHNAKRVFQGLDDQQIAQLGESLGIIYDNLAKNAPWMRRFTSVDEP